MGVSSSSYRTYSYPVGLLAKSTDHDSVDSVPSSADGRPSGSFKYQLHADWISDVASTTETAIGTPSTPNFA